MSIIYYLPLGFLVGVLFRRFMLSIKSANTFAESILPTIVAMQSYSEVLIRQFDSAPDVSEIEKCRYQLEKALTTRGGLYPEWVYKAGFNPELRAGARSYLIRVERAVELLFSTEFILHRSPSVNVMVADYLESVKSVNDINHELIMYLTSYFSGHPVMISDRDYTTDIKNLDALVGKRVSGSLALLDITPGYLDMVSLSRNLKDLRQVLLNLVSSLPAGGG